MIVKNGARSGKILPVFFWRADPFLDAHFQVNSASAEGSDLGVGGGSVWVAPLFEGREIAPQAQEKSRAER